MKSTEAKTTAIGSTSFGEEQQGRRLLRNSYRWIVKAGISRISAILLGALLLPGLAFALDPCAQWIHIDGVVTDATGAVIPGARVQASNGSTTATDEMGHYVLPCSPATATTITVQMDGFARGIAHAHAHAGGIAHVNLQLAVAPVETEIEVNANGSGIDSNSNAGTTVLGSEEVKGLSDDPDDFLRELQALTGSGGGSSASTAIAVDGFLNTSALPPKDAISSIRVNPDLFSSEYETAPWMGARIEITTRPGDQPLHGALFLAESDGSFNATDPFSAIATPAGKRRYGFELSGPITGKKSDFFLALETRNIDEFSVVDAVALNGSGEPAALKQTVAAPQRLWIASARADWQITSKDLATLSFSANVNNLGNQSAGGLVLPEAGYDSLSSEYDLRLINTLALSAHLLHETRISCSWHGTQQTPLSTQPAVQVEGYFAGGGSASGSLNDRERDIEADDDVELTSGRHTMKLGLQSLGFFVRDYNPDTFNGAYVFGGGSAPALDGDNNPTGAITTITAIEQYRRTLLNLPGGTPTTFQINAGNPLVPVTQWRLALYAQDRAKLNGRFTMNSGLRYQLQTAPGSFLNFSPRVSLAWSPDSKSNWVIHLRAGLFSSPVAQSYALQVDRLNGVRQQEETVYAPSFQNPLTPAFGSVAVSTLWQLPRTFGQLPAFGSQFGVEHEFPRHWHAEADFNFGANWDQIRAENINAPIVASSIGVAPNPIAALLAPRPIARNQNIFRYEKRAHLRGEFLFLSLRQNNYKRFGISANYVRMTGVRSDGGFRAADTTGAANPQSSYSKHGESSRVDWQTPDYFTFTGNVKLPFKVDLSSMFNAMGGRPYNITTGTDANGDGDFNDRPSYASSPGPGVYSTPFGLLTANTVNGDVPRNLGTMPGLMHLDVNVSRAFALRSSSKDHSRTFTFNARSANLLNHTNVTAVNTVVSSSAIGRPIAAETARRVELGIRFAF